MKLSNLWIQPYTSKEKFFRPKWYSSRILPGILDKGIYVSLKRDWGFQFDTNIENKTIYNLSNFKFASFEVVIHPIYNKLISGTWVSIGGLFVKISNFVVPNIGITKILFNLK